MKKEKHKIKMTKIQKGLPLLSEKNSL